MKWYNVEIPYNTKEYINRTNAFRAWLINHNVKHEICGADEYAHFEVYANEKMVSMINQALDTLVWFDSI